MRVETTSLGVGGTGGGFARAVLQVDCRGRGAGCEVAGEEGMMWLEGTIYIRRRWTLALLRRLYQAREDRVIGDCGGGSSVAG